MPFNFKSVLILDGVDIRCSEILLKNGFEVTCRGRLTKEELLEILPNYEALVVRSATKVTDEIIEGGSKLVVIARAGAGVDNIDVDAAAKKGIHVINAAGANAISACELTCGLILSLCRHVIPAAASVRAGRWDRGLYTGTEVYGKTLAVLGLGRVGREVSKRMHAFGMKVVCYDPMVSVWDCNQYNATKVTFEEVWPCADIITVHTPVLPSTINLIRDDILSCCKKGVKIINVGRGHLINEQDLLNALTSGQVSAAALDVFREEPPTDPVTLELIQHPAVVATPHLGAYTEEAQVRVGEDIAKQLVNMVTPDTYDCKISYNF